MNKILETVKLIFTAIGWWLGFYLGSVDAFIYTLLAFVIADYLTGVLRAGVERKRRLTNAGYDYYEVQKKGKPAFIVL